MIIQELDKHKIFKIIQTLSLPPEGGCDSNIPIFLSLPVTIEGGGGLVIHQSWTWGGSMHMYIDCSERIHHSPGDMIIYNVSK